MLNLLIKDFRLMFSRGRGGAKGFLRALLTAFFLLCFVAIEIVLFSLILSQIKNFNNAPRAFIMLFLLVLSVFMTISGVFQAKKLFFNEQDIAQLTNHPVDNSKLILSKLIFLFVLQYVTSFLFEYPVFVAYGLMHNKSPWFYYISIFYPLLASIFEIGVALLLVYPVRMFLQYLKRHIVLEFCLAVGLIFALVYPYSLVLNTFTDLVANNEISLLFTEESMQTMTWISEHAVPINFLVDMFISNNDGKLYSYLAISLGVFILGLAITIYTFHRVRNMTVNTTVNPREFKYKLHSQTYGLVKKEIALLTKNPDYIFSFTGLLLAQPFLVYLIVRAMNDIFTTGTFLYYTQLFPNFVALVDVFLVMMITLIINSGANQYISMEERTIKNLKTIPVSYKRQLTLKLFIPFGLSVLFLAISQIALWIGGVVTGITGLFSFVLSTVALLMFDIISLREELNIRHGKPRSTYLSSLFSYVLPLAYILLTLFLSYNGFPLWAMYLLGVVLFAVLGLPQIIKVKRNMGDWFMELEAIN